jgi:hypothetical protein
MRALLLLSMFATSLGAQAPSPPPVEQQLAAAVLPLPPDMRAGATVMGYREAGKLVVLREGTNGMRCLALYAARPDFHVACYHDGLEPFMARGRALRAEGMSAAQVDTVRFREVRERTLAMPAMGSLYSISAKREDYDAATNAVSAGNLLTVVYVPNATAESLGISARPRRDGPWLMFPGTPKAHIMIAGTMSP